MKAKVTLTLIVLMLLIASPLLMAFTPVGSILQPSATPLDVILQLALGFASLAGVAALVAVIVQVFKLAGLVKDGTSNKWISALNLIAFIVLVAFQIFKPSIAIAVLDGYAAQIAQIALFVLGFVVQMTTSTPVYNAFKSAGVPLLRYSLTNAKSTT